MRTSAISPFLACLLVLAACGDDGGATGTGSGSGSGGSDGDGGSSSGPTTVTTGPGSSGATTTSGSSGATTTSGTTGQGGEDTTSQGGAGQGGDTTSQGGAGQGGDTTSGDGGAGGAFITAGQGGGEIIGSGGGLSIGTGVGSGGAGGGSVVDACPGEFECANGDCIPFSWFCDGDNGCGDLEDESADACQGGGFSDAGVCDSGVAADNPGHNLCLGARCCDEFNDCTADGTDVDSCVACFNDGGGAQCDAAIDCFVNECSNEFSAVCDSGLTFNDVALDDCLGFSCCDEFTTCTDGGADVNACIDCLNAGSGALCNAALDCYDASCAPEEAAGVCDSGLTTNDAAYDVCLTDNCCDEFNFCTDNGLDVDGCIECIQAGGGAFCNDALDCDFDFCAP